VKKKDILKPNQEAIDSATNRIMKAVKKEPSDEFFEKIEATNVWGKLPTYDDYHEPTETELQLDRIKTELNKLVDETEYPNPEFEETFKKRIKDILA
jgi:hypothetical protein